jgi:hypothetical protein
MLPRFYFDVREGARVSRDDVGLDLESLDIAEGEAIRAAADISRDSLPKGRASEFMVEVRDEHGQQVLIVAMSMMVRRIDLTHL